MSLPGKSIKTQMSFFHHLFPHLWLDAEDSEGPGKVEPQP